MADIDKNFVQFMQEEKYDEIISALCKEEFEEDYYAESLLEQAQYKKACKLWENGKTEEATEIFLKLSTHENEIYNEYLSEYLSSLFTGIKKGDTVSFGRYYQDLLLGKESIEWVVLEVQKDRALLVSKKILDYQIFSEYKTIWKWSDLRIWLNSTFLYRAFNSHEQKLILNSSVESDEYDQFPYSCDCDIFLLGKKECLIYEPILALLDYDTEKSLKTANKLGTMWVNDWWIRSGERYDYTSHTIFNTAQSAYVGVRPVIWVSFKN